MCKIGVRTSFTPRIPLCGWEDESVYSWDILRSCQYVDRATERPPLVGEVAPTFADRGCCVVSATDSHGR
jgi:hypothetical protein